jgi:hypothetical protein
LQEPNFAHLFIIAAATRSLTARHPEFCTRAEMV